VRPAHPDPMIDGFLQYCNSERTPAESAQMRLAQHDDVVHALARDCAVQPLCKEFCHGEPAAMGLSRMPMARNRRATATP
jgi:hypothetical protein